MQSCDTLALCAKYSKFGQNMFAKNSDRPTAETQLLCAYPAKKYESGATVALTDLEIPQIEATYAVVGSRPYWTWGFEMGYNEKGLIIGNEAQGSKNAAETDTGILGMDLLRLGLERAATAREAISVITELLENTVRTQTQVSFLTEDTKTLTFSPTRTRYGYLKPQAESGLQSR